LSWSGLRPGSASTWTGKFRRAFGTPPSSHGQASWGCCCGKALHHFILSISHRCCNESMPGPCQERVCGVHATIRLSNLNVIAVFSPRCAPAQPNFPRNRGDSVPRFFLRGCGILEWGCLHLVCRSCRYSLLVALSCKLPFLSWPSHGRQRRVRLRAPGQARTNPSARTTSWTTHAVESRWLAQPRDSDEHWGWRALGQGENHLSFKDFCKNSLEYFTHSS
jgi:hypothetical protein